MNASAESRLDPETLKASWTSYIKPALFGILLLYVVLFVFFNRDTVLISFIFATAAIPLIFALLGTFLIGLILGAGFMTWWRRRSADKQSRPPSKTGS